MATAFPRRAGALGLVAAIGALAPAADLVVDPRGNDAWPGTEAAPLATLQGARDAVRRLLAETPRRDVTVLIRGGMYRLAETVVFGPADTAAPGQVITYAAWPGEQPVFSGSVPVTGWSRPPQVPAAFPVKARPHLWQADVSALVALRRAANRLPPGMGLPRDPEDDARIGMLFRDGKSLPRARGTGFTLTERSATRGAGSRTECRIPPGAVRPWEALADGDLVVIPASYWVMNVLPLAGVDVDGGTATVRRPATYPLTMNGMGDRPSCWVENIPDGLDEPGEWYVNPRTGSLWLWWDGNGEPSGIEAPVLTELVRVEGAIDYDGPADRPVRGLVFRGLTFTGGDRLPWHGTTGWGLQHDWEMFDRPSALLRLRGAEDCGILDCTFAHSGHTAVRLDLHAQRNRLVGNHIHHVGGVGILLAGYGPGTKDVNRNNVVTDNWVHHIGLTYWGSPAVFAWQSGHNDISHNTIHNTPYTGIVVSGRISWRRDGQGECARTCRFAEIDAALGGDVPRPSWERREPFLHARGNRVERNDIHTVMEILGDGNAIYVSGCGGGNVVRENYCHDSFGPYMNAVIRNDDDQHGTIVEGNLCVRTRGWGEGIINKGANRIVRNVVADLRPSARHRGMLVLVRYPQHGAVIRENIFLATRPGLIAVGEQGQAGAPGDPPRLRDADSGRNLYWSTVDPQWGAAHLERAAADGVEGGSLAADPLFADIATDRFAFPQHSPAATLGLPQPVDIDLCGLREPYRSRFLPRRLLTWIEPGIDGVLRRPVTITLRSSDPQAAIHYTLDGSEPTRGAARYTGPVTLAEPAVVRARSFADGAADPAGDLVAFLPPAPPIVEDFETCTAGSPPPHAAVSEESDAFTARVVRGVAASGEQSLRFVDGPGQRYPFNPHVAYRTTLDEGRLVLRFALLAEASSDFYVQCREYTSGSEYQRGPTLRVEPGGRITHAGSELTRIPTGVWVRYELACPLGEHADGRFALTVNAPGRAPEHFPDLPSEGRFRVLHWLGFVSVGQEPAVTHVDEVECRAH